MESDFAFQNWENLRFAVVDTESTGLDASRDSIVSIAGIVVHQGEIDLADTFEVLIPISYNTSSVTLHGITREHASAGIPEDAALRAFQKWLRGDIIVGHHIGHDVKMLNAGCVRRELAPFTNPVIDTMDLTLRLEDAGALEKQESRYTLDDLCARFHLRPHDRHTASGDAFLTAQIFIRLLRYARHSQWLTLGDLAEPF